MFFPDDIPIIQKDESSSGVDIPKSLTSISEEKEEVGFSLRGSSLRSKDAVAKNLQKLGIGKKFKDKDGKTSSKVNLSSNTGNEKKQSALLQLSNLKEKVSIKSSTIQNGDYVTAEVNGHSPLSLGRMKLIENGPVGDAAGDSMSEGIGIKSSLESQSGFMSDNLDTPSPNDSCMGLFSTSKSIEEKTFTRVSSV